MSGTAGFAFPIEGLNPQLFESQQKRRRDEAEGARGASEDPPPAAKKTASGFEFPTKFDWFRFKAAPKSSATFPT